MMASIRLTAAALFILSAVGASAQTRATSTPAELPPAGYEGAQYVDSRGCVFIRAGVDGAINWIPRVNRQRKHICGMAPTLAASEEAAAPAPVVRAKPPAAPVVEAEATPETVVRPRPAPVVAAIRPKPAAPTRRPVVRSRVSAPAPTPVVELTEPPVAILSRSELGESVPSTSLPGSTRVLPLHVARQQLAAGSFRVPKGYKPAWEDDRLNPRRAEGTLRGRDRMHLIWTDTVPRRLIDKVSGRDVTANVALVYPYTDFSRQRRELGVVTLMTRNGQVVKKVDRSAKGETVLGTRSAPVAAPKAKQAESIGGARYVQVGTFGGKANAQSTAAQLRKLGLPMRIGTYQRGGQTMRIVLAGPFDDRRLAQGALGKVRRAGYADAFLRK